MERAAPVGTKIFLQLRTDTIDKCLLLEYNTPMNNNDYNGYTNRATWNIVLWASNDGGLYDYLREMYERMIQNDMDASERESQIKANLMEWYGSTTPDGDKLEDADWVQIRESLDESYDFILDAYNL